MKHYTPSYQPPPRNPQTLVATEAGIFKALGGRRVFGSRRIDLLAEVERGLPVRAYFALAKTLGLTPGEEDRLLRLRLRTRVRWKRWSRLDPTVSDRIVRVARVLALATDALDSESRAVTWLRECSDVLKGRTPLEVASSDFGAQKVTNLIAQMEHSVYS